MGTIVSHDYGVTEQPETQVLFEYCADFTPQFLPMMVRLGMFAPIRRNSSPT
jgi:hypothetical protein